MHAEPAASLTTVASDSMKKKHCKDTVGELFKVTSTADQSTDTFKKFVNEVCPSLDLRMPSKSPLHSSESNTANSCPKFSYYQAQSKIFFNQR